MSKKLKAELMDNLSDEPNTATLLDMLDEQLDLLFTGVKDLERRIDPVLRQAVDGVEEEADDAERELSEWASKQSVLNMSLKRKLNMIDRLRLTVLDLSKRSML